MRRIIWTGLRVRRGRYSDGYFRGGDETPGTCEDIWNGFLGLRIILLEFHRDSSAIMYEHDVGCAAEPDGSSGPGFGGRNIARAQRKSRFVRPNTRRERLKDYSNRRTF